jgi:hypothetical protein
VLNNIRVCITILITLKSGAVFFYKYDNISGFILLSLLFFYYILGKKKYIINKKYFLYTILISTFSLIPMFISGDYSNYLKYFKLLTFLLGMSLVPQIISFELFRDTYIKIVTFLAVNSLIIYILLLISPSIANFFPVITGYGEHVKYNNLILYVSLVTDYPNNRNYSIFYEPGVYQAFLNIAILLELHKNYLKNLLKLSIFFICLLTTFSTTGFICAFMIIIILLSDNYYKWKKEKLLIKLVTISSIFIFIFSGLFFTVFTQKFSESGYSFFTRSLGSALDYQIFLTNPLFGVGYDSYVSQIQKLAYNNYFINMSGSTNSFTNTLAKYGLFFTYTILFMHYTVGVSFTKNLFKRSIYFLILLLILTTENFTLSLFYIVLSYYGLWYYCRKRMFTPITYFFK